MTAASAPEEGRKCWLKVWYDGVWRKIEWNTSSCSFQALEAKVREMFHLNDKMKLNFSYVDADGSTNIVMSSDEEFTIAMHLLTGDFLTVKVGLQTRKRKGVLLRAFRAAKAQQPLVAERLASLPARARTLLAPLSFVEPLRTAALGAVTCARAKLGHFPRVGIPSRKILLFLFFLMLSVFLTHHSCAGGHRRAGHYHHHRGDYAVPPTSTPQVAVTILAATYGGLDVTKKLQEYVNQNGVVLASNKIFGDPTPTFHKHLHVVYQYHSPQGIAEVFSQSFPESSGPQRFAMTRDSCAFPEESIVNGKPIKVLGALYEDVSATCAARRLAATGRFSTTASPWQFDNYKDHMISKHHFGDGKSTGVGAFTLVYLKDNKLKVFKGKEGSTVGFLE